MVVAPSVSAAPVRAQALPRGLRLGMEVRALSGPAGGVVRYVRGLVPALAAALPDVSFVLFGPDGRAAEALPGTHAEIVGPALPAGRLYWDFSALPRSVRRAGVELLHRTKPAWVAQGRGDPPAVVTIYDVIPLEFPETQTFAQRAYWRLQLGAAARTAAHVLTISEASKRALVECFQLSPERITVTLPGLDPRFQPASTEACAAFRRRHGLERPYLLSVGTIEPRKNFDLFLRAAASLLSEIPHDVVIAGRRGWRTERVDTALRDPRLAGRVRLLGRVADADLPALYGGADAFVFLSAAEGFGFPPLEAMACGAPVVVSGRGSLPEAVGPAAVVVDPDDEAAVAGAIRRVLEDPGLRSSLAARASAWVPRFTWERAAQQTIAAYARVLAATHA